MCISSNSVNQAQDLMAVKKFDDVPNKQIPTGQPGTPTRKLRWVLERFQYFMFMRAFAL